LFSCFLTDPIRLPFLRCAAVLGAMRVERDHTAHDKRGDCHHHKKPHGFKFSGHKFGLANHTRLLQADTYRDAIAPAKFSFSPEVRRKKQSLIVFRLDGRC